MSSSKPSRQKLRELVHKRVGGCCEYCQTCEVNIGQAMHLEHIIPGVAIALKIFVWLAPIAIYLRQQQLPQSTQKLKKKLLYLIPGLSHGRSILSGLMIMFR